MKQIIKICVLLMCFYAMKAQALSILRAEDKVVGQRLIYTTFSDYFPFGYGLYENKKEPVLESVFKDAMSDLLQNRDELTVFKYYPTVGDAIFDMKDGKTDVFFGAFYSTEAFNDLDFVFPAILNNPIHLIMLPSKIAGVKQADDLKNLKGVYALNEHFGDYMLKTFSELNMKAVQDEDEAYESLFTGEADYILGSYYYHFAKLVEKGLKNEVAFSSKPLWNMPMFVATSKNIENRKMVHDYFRRLASSENFKKKILEKIKQLIEEKEKQSIGVVPPMYVRQSTGEELTPADERTTKGEK